MGKKLKYGLGIGSLSAIACGLWLYQVHVFNKAVHHQLVTLQESLKDYGIKFTFEGVEFSSCICKADIIKPEISGLIPPYKDWFKKDYNVHYSSEGKVNISFSPFTNTVKFTEKGDSHIRLKGALDIVFFAPATNNTALTVKYPSYDFFGNRPLISFHNIKDVIINSDNAAYFLNEEKIFEMKKSQHTVSFERAEKSMDILLDTDDKGVQWFKPSKPLTGSDENLETLNFSYKTTLAQYSDLGLDDRKISLAFHVDDFDAYIKTIKKMINEINLETISALLPEGLSIAIKKFSSNNDVYKTNSRGDFKRDKDLLVLNFLTDFKVTNKGKNHFRNYIVEVINELTKTNQASISNSINDEFLKQITPDLEALGNTHLEFNLETHFPLSFNEGKMSIKWISDPYSLSVKGKLDKNGVQAKLKTCNASSMTTDLQNYALRLKNADPSLTHIIQPFILYLQVSKKLLEKVLEPSGATRQSVDFEFSDKGVRVGKYNGEEIVKIFGETLAQNNEIPDSDQKLEEIS